MTVNEKKDLITELCKLWQCTLIDHHKDSDAHFYIKMKWSYGNEPVYIVEHYGYILEETYMEFESYSEAQDYLIKYLIEALTNECDFYLANPNNEEFVEQFKSRFITIKNALIQIKERIKCNQE